MIGARHIVRRLLYTMAGLGRILGAQIAAALIAAVVAGGATAGSVTIGGPFRLVAGDGSTVTETTFRGRWLLVYFGFTSCPVTCPTALVEIAAALAKLGPAAAALQPLFITVDPERDTTAVMHDYTQSFDPRIVGLTGTPAAIATVAEAYGVHYERHPVGPGADDYVVDHSTYIYLMDPAGRFVRGFGADASAEELADGIRVRIQLAPSSGSR
jgi:protein SCO1